MIVVHYLTQSRAHRILWLLEELGAAYEVKTYARRADYSAPESLKAVHPLGKSPVIEHDGRVIAESGAIMEYLIQTLDGAWLKPEAGSDSWVRYLYWMHAAEGSAMPPLVMRLIFKSLPKRVPFLIRPVARMISDGVVGRLLDPQLGAQVAYWDRELGREGWFAGADFSAADIAMSYPVEAALARFGPAGTHSAIRAYAEAARSRPAYQRAAARVGDCAGVPA